MGRVHGDEDQKWVWGMGCWVSTGCLILGEVASPADMSEAR